MLGGLFQFASEVGAIFLMVGDDRLNMKQDNISTEMAMSNIEKKNQFQDRRFFVTYS